MAAGEQRILREPYLDHIKVSFEVRVGKVRCFNKSLKILAVDVIKSSYAMPVGSELGS